MLERLLVITKELEPTFNTVASSKPPAPVPAICIRRAVSPALNPLGLDTETVACPEEAVEEIAVETVFMVAVPETTFKSWSDRKAVSSKEEMLPDWSRKEILEVE